MKNWSMFGSVGLILGSSFLLISKGVAEVSPFILVSGRLTFASIVFAVTLIAIRKPIPLDRRSLLSLAFVGLCNTADDFFFVIPRWQTIDSGFRSCLKFS